MSGSFEYEIKTFSYLEGRVVLDELKLSVFFVLLILVIDHYMFPSCYRVMTTLTTNSILTTEKWVWNVELLNVWSLL